MTVEIPRDLVAPADAAHLGANLRFLWAVEQVRPHRLGIGRAAEVASVPRAAFMQMLGAHGVPVIDYSAADFQEELWALDIP